MAQAPIEAPKIQNGRCSCHQEQGIQIHNRPFLFETLIAGRKLYYNYISSRLRKESSFPVQYKKERKKMNFLSVAVACVAVLVMLLIQSHESRLLLHPTRCTSYRNWNANNSVEHNLPKTQGKLLEFKLDHVVPHRTLLLVPGNAGNADSSFSLVKRITESCPRCQVFLLEYPGYGSSSWKHHPEPYQLVQTLQEAWDLYFAEISHKTALIGFSMGGGCIAQFLLHHDGRSWPQQVFIMNSYSSLPAVVRSLLPFPFSFLCKFMKTKWDSLPGLTRFPNNLVLVATKDDSLISYRQTEFLFKHLKNTNKNELQKVILPHGGHNGSLDQHLSLWFRCLW